MAAHGLAGSFGERRPAGAVKRDEKGGRVRVMGPDPNGACLRGRRRDWRLGQQRRRRFG